MSSQKQKPSSTEAHVKISGKIGEGTSSPLIKIYNDYENTHLAGRDTEFNLEPHEIEKVLAKEELKEKLVEEKFKNYLQAVIKNSLTILKDDEKILKVKESFYQLAGVTESPKLAELLRTVIGNISWKELQQQKTALGLK